MFGDHHEPILEGIARCSCNPISTLSGAAPRRHRGAAVNRDAKWNQIVEHHAQPAGLVPGKDRGTLVHQVQDRAHNQRDFDRTHPYRSLQRT